MAKNKKQIKLADCQKEIENLLKSVGNWSEEMVIQAEVVGTQLYLYRRIVAKSEEVPLYLAGSSGQDVLNPIFEQTRKFSDDLRKGLASLQMNKEKATVSSSKRDKEKNERNRLEDLVKDMNEKFGE